MNTYEQSWSHETAALPFFRQNFFTVKALIAHETQDSLPFLSDIVKKPHTGKADLEILIVNK